MVARDKLNELLITFARTLVTEYAIDEMLDRLCSQVVEVLGCEGAGVMLEDDAGHLRFVAASDEKVRQIEALQIEFGEGPCLHAYQTGEIVVIPDLHTTDRFPAFTARAREEGMRSVHSFALRADNQCVGALNMYSSAAADFGDAEVEAGMVLADVCTTYILNSRTLAESYKLAGQLQRALDSRVVIEQAKGKLAEQLQVSVTEAFEVMRRHARNNGRKLHEIAAEIVEGTLRLEVLN